MGTQRGFTIIEVILFLAITGLLLFAALQSVGSTISDSRYTDTLKSMQSYLQAQYTQVQSGVSQRNTAIQSCGILGGDKTPGASDGCIVMGRLINVKKSTNTLEVSTIVGDVDADAGPTGSCSGGVTGKLANIGAHCPRVVVNGIASGWIVDDTYRPEWGATLGTVNYVNGPGASVQFDKVAFIRDPSSEVSYILTYKDTSGDSLIDPSYLINGNVNRPAVICLKGTNISIPGFAYFSGASSLSSIQAGINKNQLDPALGTPCS